jgi:putative transposase
MARPLRIQFPGALYHVTSRGNHQQRIFADDIDRQAFLSTVARGLERFGAMALAYCLMDNHYHFVIYTRLANLSALMRHINGVTTQTQNRRHRNSGHLFQGRFKAILVDQEAYLLEVCRYVELNPVRARMVKDPADWPWSSYRAHVGLAEVPPWLDTARVHGQVLGRDPQTARDLAQSRRRYAQLVAAALDLPLWDQALNRQVYLGDEDFVRRMQAKAAPSQTQSKQVPKAQRSAPKTLADWLRSCATREEALRCAYTQSGLTMTAMGKELGLTAARVSQLIAKAEQS